MIASAALEGVALGAVAAGIVPLVPLALAGAALALVFPALAVWVVEAAPERERGTAVGAMTSCWDVGIAAAGPFGALLVVPGRPWAGVRARGGPRRTGRARRFGEPRCVREGVARITVLEDGFTCHPRLPGH